MKRFYVSLDGDDRWGGTAPDPDRSGGDGPFRSLARARDAVRALPRPRGPVEVLVRGGTHFLDSPLRLTAEDGGEAGAPVAYRAYAGERPVLSGGRRITGWRPVRVHGRAAWAADLPDVRSGAWTFHELFVDGARRARPRLPRTGYHRIRALPEAQGEWQIGQNRFEFAPGDIRDDWKNLADVEAVVLHFWVDSHLPLSAVDSERRMATFSRTSIFRLTDDHRSTGARYYLENVWEALGDPGQWYLDRPAGILYYLPMPGEDPAESEVIAPFLGQILDIRGDGPAEPAGAQAGGGGRQRHVGALLLEGLTFAHAEWRLPEGGKGGASQAAVDVPAAVRLEMAQGCVIRGCRVAHCGTYGIHVGAGCRDTAIEHNRLADLGAGGIRVDQASSGTRILDNEIVAAGRVFHAGVGVLILDSGGNEVRGNHIHDLYYTGISVGWVWGYGPSAATENRIEGNHIHDIGQGVLNDLGGIYTLGVSPGTILRGNRIHDVRSDGYGGWGIYLDEGSTGILVEGNVVYRTKTGGLHQHYGRDNIVRNNVFAWSAEGQIQRSRIEDHSSFTFEGNIVYFDRGPLLTGAWQRPAARFDRNLYFAASGETLDCAGRTWAQWQALGMDERSLVADPRFADPDAGDFTLAADSPALDLGFVPLPAEVAGRPARPPRSG